MRFALLAALISSSLAVPSHAAPTNNVVVVNSVDQPVPVSVEGTASVNVANTPAVTVANTPAVTVANTPAVTVANTPAVTIANSPTVQLSPEATVRVGNPASAPLPVRDVDMGARRAFQASVNLDMSGTSGTGLTIPAGKRLVIEFVSVSGSSSTSTQPYVDIFATLAGSPLTSYLMPLAQSPIAPQQVSLAQSVKIYADQVFVSLAFSGATPSSLLATVSLSGYLVDQ